jgi:integrase
VTDILTDYATERGEKVMAGDRIAYAVEALAPYWEGNTVAHVTRETCEAYVKHRAVKPAQGKRKERHLSPGTARRELGVLAAAINHAHREGRITRTVVVFLPERPEAKERWLTRQEAGALLRASRTRQARLYMPLFILIGLYTGRRKEAILSLRWPQVDLAAGLIHFDKPGRRQTKKRRGTVRIPARLLPHLRRARRRGTDLGHVIHADGERIGDIKKGFQGACSRAGLTDVTPHTLRHTAATWLMQAGVDKWVASGFLAMSMETLERVYGHHHPDYQGEAAEAIGRRPQNVRRIQ